MPLIEKLIEEAVDEIGDYQSEFDDMFDFASHVIDVMVHNLYRILPEKDPLLNDEDDLVDLIKDVYSDDIFQHYTHPDEDEDEELL